MSQHCQHNVELTEGGYTGDRRAACASEELMQVLDKNQARCDASGCVVSELITEVTEKHNPITKAPKDVAGEDAVRWLHFRCDVTLDALMSMAPGYAQSIFEGGKEDMSELFEKIKANGHSQERASCILHDHEVYYGAMKKFQFMFDKLKATEDRALAKIERLKNADVASQMPMTVKLVEKCVEKENGIATDVLFGGYAPIMSYAVSTEKVQCYTGELQAARAWDEFHRVLHMETLPDEYKSLESTTPNDKELVKTIKTRILMENSPNPISFERMIGPDAIRYQRYVLNFMLEADLRHLSSNAVAIWNESGPSPEKDMGEVESLIESEIHSNNPARRRAALELGAILSPAFVSYDDLSPLKGYFELLERGRKDTKAKLTDLRKDMAKNSAEVAKMEKTLKDVDAHESDIVFQAILGVTLA